MQSPIFKLAKHDIVKGCVVAFLSAVVAYIISALDAPGFDFGTFDFPTLIRVGIVSMLGYLLKNFLTTKEGAVLGVIK